MFSSTTAAAAGFACLAALSAQVRAHPSRFQGDVTKAVPGGAFGLGMGIDKYEATSSDACKITHDIPDVGFTIGGKYTFTISTNADYKTGLGMVYKVGAQQETVSMGKSKAFAWTGTGDNISASAICGAGGLYGKLHAAAPVTAKKVAPGTSTTAKTTTTTATTTTTTTAQQAMCGDVPKKIPADMDTLVRAWCEGGTAQFGVQANYGDIGCWDTSEVKSMRQLFRQDECKTFNENIDAWQTSLVTDMYYLFFKLENFNQPMDSWQTSSATNMAGLFRDTAVFDQDVDSWQVGSARNLAEVFMGTKRFNQPLNSWRLSAATDIGGMFSRSAAFDQDIDSWPTSSVVTFSSNNGGMFRYAEKFNQPLDSWQTSSATSMDRMFEGAIRFDQALPSWQVANVTHFKFTSGSFCGWCGLSGANKLATYDAWKGQNDVFAQEYAAWEVTTTSTTTTTIITTTTTTTTTIITTTTTTIITTTTTTTTRPAEHLLSIAADVKRFESISGQIAKLPNVSDVLKEAVAIIGHADMVAWLSDLDRRRVIAVRLGNATRDLKAAILEGDVSLADIEPTLEYFLVQNAQKVIDFRAMGSSEERPLTHACNRSCFPGAPLERARGMDTADEVRSALSLIAGYKRDGACNGPTTAATCSAASDSENTCGFKSTWYPRSPTNSCKLETLTLDVEIDRKLYALDMYMEDLEDMERRVGYAEALAPSVQGAADDLVEILGSGGPPAATLAVELDEVAKRLIMIVDTRGMKVPAKNFGEYIARPLGYDYAAGCRWHCPGLSPDPSAQTSGKTDASLALGVEDSSSSDDGLSTVAIVAISVAGGLTVVAATALGSGMLTAVPAAVPNGEHLTLL